MDGIGLVRKVSQGFPKDKSKWRLNRSGSKPSLALDGGDEDDEVDLPSSPATGKRNVYCVSPRHCGTAFLPDDEVEVQPPTIPLKPFTESELHLVNALRVFAKELEAPSEPLLKDRLRLLEEASRVELPVFNQTSNEVVGLQNPLNSKICYLNSVMQILLPIAPLIQVLSLSLSHGSAGVWTTATARAFRLFFRPKMGVPASLLTVSGMDTVIKELGGVGTQQDVAEALGIVLDRLHNEWKHTLRKQPWSVEPMGVNTPSNHGLGEDSIVYKLFRGIKCVSNRFEIFTGIHLAPPTNGKTSLVELLRQNFENELHYLPPVLCIELSRHLSENQLTTSQSSVPFSGAMTVPQSCCTSQCNATRRYELVGAVVRSGVYANSGHFWAAQRRGNKWSWINDTEVSECDVTTDEQADATDCLISKRLDAASNWCVLVYADVEAKVAIHPYL